MFTQAEYINVSNDNKIAALDVEDSIADYSMWADIVALSEKLNCFGEAVWCATKSFTFGIFANVLQNSLHCGSNLGLSEGFFVAQNEGYSTLVSKRKIMEMSDLTLSSGYGNLVLTGDRSFRWVCGAASAICRQFASLKACLLHRFLHRRMH